MPETKLMNSAEIQAILQHWGSHVPPGSKITLVGGSALAHRFDFNPDILTHLQEFKQEG